MIQLFWVPFLQYQFWRPILCCPCRRGCRWTRGDWKSESIWNFHSKVRTEWLAMAFWEEIIWVEPRCEWVILDFSFEGCRREEGVEERKRFWDRENIYCLYVAAIWRQYTKEWERSLGLTNLSMDSSLLYGSLLNFSIFYAKVQFSLATLGLWSLSTSWHLLCFPSEKCSLWRTQKGMFNRNSHSQWPVLMLRCMIPRGTWGHIPAMLIGALQDCVH